MNPRIVRLTYVAIALVGVLVVMTTYWQTWAAPGLAARQDNAIKRVAEFAVDRDVAAPDGLGLAIELTLRAGEDVVSILLRPLHELRRGGSFRPDRVDENDACVVLPCELHRPCEGHARIDREVGRHNNHPYCRSRAHGPPVSRRRVARNHRQGNDREPRAQ